MYRRRNSNEVLQEEQQNGIMSDSGTALPDRAVPSSSSSAGAKQKRKNFRKSNSVEPRNVNHQRKKSFSNFWDKLFSSKSTNNTTTDPSVGNRLSGVSIESTSFESVNTILSTNSFTFVNPKKCKGKHVKGKRIPVQDDEGNKTVVGHRGGKKKVGTLTRIGMKMGLKSKYNLQSCESLHHLSYLESQSNFGTLGSTYRKKRRAPPPPWDLPENEQENLEPQQLQQVQQMQTKQQPKKQQELPKQPTQRPEPPETTTIEQPPATAIPSPPSPKPSTSRAVQNPNNFDPKTFKIYPRHQRSSSDGPALTPLRSSPVQSTSQTLNRTKFHVRGKRKAPAPPNPFGDPDAPEETEEEQEETEQPSQVSLTSTNENVPKTQNSVLNSPTRQSGPSSSSHVSNTTNNHATVNTEAPENNANTNLQQQQSLPSTTTTATAPTPPSIQIENEDEIFQNNLNEQLFQEQEKEQQQQQQQQQPENGAQPGPSRLSQAPTEQQLAAAQRELQVLMTVGTNAPQPKTWLDERTKQELLELKREAEKSPLLFLRSKSKQANGSAKNSRNSSTEVRNSSALSPSVSPTPEQQQQQTEGVYGETKKLTPKPWYKRSSSSSSSEKKNKKILQPYSGMTKFSDIEREANRIVEEQRRRSAEQGFHDSARELITMFNSFNETQRTPGSVGPPTDENSRNVELEGQRQQQPVASTTSATAQSTSTAVEAASTAVTTVVQISSPRVTTTTVPTTSTSSAPVSRTTMATVSSSTTTTTVVNSMPSNSSARASLSGETPKMAIVRPQSSPQPKQTTAAATVTTTVSTTSASKLSTGVPTFANYPIIQRREDWICSRCTLKNAAWRLTCEACYQSSIHKISAVFESTSGSTTAATSSAPVNTNSTAATATVAIATPTTTSASNVTTTTTSSGSTVPVCANFIPQVTPKEENKEGVKLDSNDGGEELGIEQLRLQRLAFFGKQSTPSSLNEPGASETGIPQQQAQSTQPVVTAATEAESEEKRQSQIFSDDEDDTIDELIGLQRPTTKLTTPDPAEPEQPDMSNMPTFGPRNWNPFQMNRFRPMLESIIEQSQDVYARIDAPYYENWEFGQGLPPHPVNMAMDGRNWMTNTFMQNYPHNNLPNTDNNLTANFSPYYSNSESSSCSECETGSHSRTEVVMDGKNREPSRRHSQHHSRHFYGFYPSSPSDPSGDHQNKLSLEDYRKLGAIPKYLLDQEERLHSQQRSGHHHHHHSHSRRHSSALDEQSRASPSLGKGHEDRARGNTSVEVEKLLRRLEWAIAEGDHKLAATLAHDLALLKVNCVVAKEDDMTKPIRIRVYVEDRFMQQGPFQVQVTKIMTVKELKQKIESDWSIPLAFQKWILGRKMSENDDQKLLDFEISHDDMAFLYLVTPQIDPEPPVPPKPATMSKVAPVKTSTPGPSGSQVRPQQPANLPAKKPAQALPAAKEVIQEAYVNVVPPKSVAIANKPLNVPQVQATSAKVKKDTPVSEIVTKKVTAGVQATASAPSPVSNAPVLPPKSAALTEAKPAAAPIVSAQKAQAAPPQEQTKLSSKQVQPAQTSASKTQPQTKQYQPPQLPPKAATEVSQSPLPPVQKPLNPPKAPAAPVADPKLAAKSPKIVTTTQIDTKPAPSKTTPEATSSTVPAKPTETSKVTITKVTHAAKEPLKEVKPPSASAVTNFNSTPKPFKPLPTASVASVPLTHTQSAPAPSPIASTKLQTSPQPQNTEPAKQLSIKEATIATPKAAVIATTVQKPTGTSNVVAAKSSPKALESKPVTIQSPTPAVATKVSPATSTNMTTVPSTPSTTKTSTNSPAIIAPRNNALTVAPSDTEPVPMRRTKKKQTDPGARNSITPEPSSSDAESTPKRHSSPVPPLLLPIQQPVAKVATESQPAPLPLLPENKQGTEEKIKPKTPTESPKPKRAQVQKVEAGCQSTLPLPTKIVKQPPKQATDPPPEVSIVSTTNVHVPGKEEAAAGPAVILKDDVGTADPKKLAKPETNKENNATEAYNQMLQLLEKSDLIFNSEEFDCPVCFSNVGVNEGVVLRECLHSFCKECLIGSVQYAEEPEVKCPYRDDKYSCNSLVQEREIKALVPPEVFERHLAKSVKIAEGKIANTFHCRTADCAGWCVFEDDVNIFLCPVCKKRNCLTCQAIHDGMDCQQYQRQLAIDSETDENAKSSRLMLEKMIQRGEALECPACHVVLLKKWGCDWVRCSYCKTEICWITKGFRWGPNGKGDTSGGCKCGVNGVRCHPKCTYCH